MTQSDNNNSFATDVEETSDKGKTEKIRALNDALRTRSGGDGMIVLTQVSMAPEYPAIWAP